MLSKSSDRQELSNAGVYFLIGKSDDQLRDKVYIGESEDVLYRLNQHITAGQKEWQDWSDCVGLFFPVANIQLVPQYTRSGVAVSTVFFVIILILLHQHELTEYLAIRSFTASS